jgi:hypothetical protein
MVFLLTWHGTLLCRRRQDGALVHRPLTDRSEDAAPVELDMPIERLRAEFSHHLRAVLPELPDHAPGALQRFHMRWAADQRTLNFYHGNVFLSAALSTGLVEALAPKAEDWEAFLPVSQAVLDALRELLGSSWLVRSTGALVERPAMWRFFNLLLGDIAVDLRYQLPLDLANWPHRLTLLRDGWRIEQLCLYRPLVYYAAFGSPAIMQQFAASVVSLIEFGRYQGHIAVLTDHSQTQLAELLPADVLARLAIVQFKPSDRPGFMTARYLILDLPNAWQFQPILYIDADVVFDRDVAPMLREIAVSDRIAAPFEPFSALRRSPPSGATLLQRDHCSPGDVAGFNTGTLGIPNLRAHAETLRLIRRIIANHSLLYGRGALPYADQEIANYLAFRLANFDTTLIARFVRVGGTDSHPRDGVGLAHFWGVAGAAARAQAMRDYLTLLRAG